MASVTEQFNDIISLYSTKLEHTSLRQDSPEYQGLLLSTIKKLLNLKTAIFDRLALFSTNAVSYTHLDVYKRQVY